MENVQINVQSRSQSGKGSARKLRAEGLAPGVIYGRGVEPVNITFSPRDLRGIVRRSPQHRNVVLQVNVEGGDSHNVLIQDVQHHPVSRDILHVDLLNISFEEEVDVVVPIKLVGRSLGVKAGGRLTQLVRSVQIRCLPGIIPAEVDVDVSELDRKETLRVDTIVPPEGVKILFTDNYGVAVIN